MKPYKNKINRIRSFALSLIFIGVVIMYIGIFFRNNEIVMLSFMVLGVLAIIASTVVYAWIGSLSTRAVQIQCPTCGRHTKMLGRVDMCGHCREPLTLDPTLEGKEFDESYNRSRPKSKSEKTQQENNS
ncbi:YgzB family protein [Sporosarcina sp. ACRSM]|uniref:YgzB family protein n=1 Tax=Sporosarcina sp. ACRSM TaxID=2918216 RepID=UPI001EF4CBC9|nr:YgzB family protein [Sporosarcina sp. ACRSM]MCG7336802.1 YgzB family protein [Sporosarcina sp. ACRSM]